MTALCMRVCMYACWFGQTTYSKLQMSTFKFYPMVDVHTDAFVYFTSSAKPENKREGQLADCSISMKESESKDDLS